MEKKLTAQGPHNRKSYTVTLPLDWVKQQKLDRTRKVELTVVGKKVVISAGTASQDRVVLDGEIYGKVILRSLHGLYRMGVAEIKINTSDPAVITEVIDVMNRAMIGFEVVEQRKDYLLIKDITKIAAEEFGTIMRRIFLLMLELTDAQPDQSLTLMRSTKKLINYGQRILILNGHQEYEKTPIYYVLLDHLEKLNDELHWLLSTQTKPSKELVKLFRTAYELVYTFDPLSYSTSLSRSYQLKNQLRGETVSRPSMHQHNIARLINSIYGDIFTLHCKQLP